ncbi:MAG: ADP-ribosylglycohydrolase family protein [Eubacteriales bacterium]|nr:ADP-ribosylglycohydrolase family protein [Eubacteriales bacterium]
MLSKEQLFSQLEHVVSDMELQGYDVQSAHTELYQLPLSYDALLDFAHKLPKLPLRKDYRYVEPSAWEEIVSEMDNPPVATKVSPHEIEPRIRQAFLASVCGCILGKPFETNPDMGMIRDALTAENAWPLDDYPTGAVMEHMPRQHPSRNETIRENICYAAADDDINYTVVGMLNLEKNGFDFTHQQLANIWGESLPLFYTFGPERVILARIGENSLFDLPYEDEWPDVAVPRNEMCGAMIRADAYGYACAGDPLKAARLAWKDGSLTHRRNGVYGEMFAAAAIAEAFVAKEPLQIFETALRCVPRRSRFYERVSRGYDIVASAPDYFTAYEQIHAELGEYTHCLVYQETATLINTLRFAKDCGTGICLQVMQGNDTDSYGCTAGSILGAYYGEGSLEAKWLAPFDDQLQLAIARAPEHSLNALANRMSKLAFLKK